MVFLLLWGNIVYINNEMRWVTILSIILTLILLVCLVSIIIRPTPLKILFRRLQPAADYAPHEDAQINARYTLYQHKQLQRQQRLGGISKNLVVCFIGGAMITCNRNCVYGALNYLYEHLTDTNNNTYDLLVFEYPTRFESTLHQTMLSINETLSEFTNYKRVHAIGFSVGAMLAGAFYQKESNKMISEAMNVPQIGMTFTSFVGICGLYETVFAAEILTKLFKFYILRNTPATINYTCYGMNIPRFIISSTSDFLYSQTSKFIHEQPVAYKIYKSQTLPHSFLQYINLPEARDALDRIIAFIRQTDQDL